MLPVADDESNEHSELRHVLGVERAEIGKTPPVGEEEAERLLHSHQSTRKLLVEGETVTAHAFVCLIVGSGHLGVELKLVRCHIEGRAEHHGVLEGKIRLDQCVIDELDFSGVEFQSEFVLNRCEIENVWFDDCHFRRRATFTNVRFGQTFAMARTRFEDTADLRECQFLQPVRFEATTFNGPCVLDKTVVSKGLTFDRAKLGRSVSLEEARGPGSVDFDRVEFSGPTLIALGAAPTSLRGTVVDEPLTIAAHRNSQAVLTQVTNCAITAPLTMASYTRLTQCMFAGSTGLERLRFSGDPLWPVHTKTLGRRPVASRLTLHDEWVPIVSPVELEALYRQLRDALESSKAYPAAGDFFYGEMLARRKSCSKRRPRVAELRNRDSADAVMERSNSRPRRAEWWMLTAYQHLGGYGVRASRPMLAAFVAICLATGLFTAFDSHLLASPPPREFLSGDSVRTTFSFVLTNSFNLFRPTTDGLAWDGAILLVLTRLVVVVFLGFAAAALRSRVKR